MLIPILIFIQCRVVLQSFCPTGKSIHSVTVYLSDFGKEQLEAESKYGVQGIWASSTAHNSDPDDEDDGEYEDEDDEDEQEEGSDEDEGTGDDAPEADEDADEEPILPIQSGKREKGDFTRRPGHIGVVMANETKSNKLSSSSTTNTTKPRKQDTDIDEISLRRYELNKLRYYFAIAICDSISTSEAVYNEVDGLEMEHSAMVFDLRFVPDDVQ